jgi:hypothetical protein
MSFSPNLVYMLDRLQGYSTNTFRLETHNKTIAKSGDIVSFDLPANSLVSTRSFKVFCNASCDPAVAGGVACGARLPQGIDLLVERVEVTMGGIMLSQGANAQNVLIEAGRALGQFQADSLLSHPEMVRKTSYVDGNPIVGTDNETYPSGKLSRFCISKFPGFLDSCEPKILDLSLLPDCKIRLYMASDNVLTTSIGPELSNFTAIGAKGARYVLTDIFATIECMSLADATYDNMVASQMSQNGFLECPFKQYNCFQETHHGASRFTISSASLDRVWVAWRSNDYNDQHAPIAVAGYKKTGAFVSSESTVFNNAVDVGIPGYDHGGVLGTNAEKYKSKYFNFAAPNKNMTMQMSLNSTFFPQFQADLGVLAGITQNSLPGSGASLDKTRTLDQYLKHGCVQCFRLNMADSEYSRTLSGLDTRSSNLAGIITTTGAGSDNLQISIFTESTSVLRIGAGKSLELIA